MLNLIDMFILLPGENCQKRLRCATIFATTHILAHVSVTRSWRCTHLAGAIVNYREVIKLRWAYCNTPVCMYNYRVTDIFQSCQFKDLIKAWSSNDWIWFCDKSNSTNFVNGKKLWLASWLILLLFRVQNNQYGYS